MLTAFPDLIVALLWSLVLSAGAWLIAIMALADVDEISQVVAALTRTSGVETSPRHQIQNIQCERVGDEEDAMERR